MSVSTTDKRHGRRTGPHHLARNVLAEALCHIDGMSLPEDQAQVFRGGGSVAGHGVPASGGCLSFDGINDYVECGNDASVQITGALTVSAWFKTDGAVTNQAIVSKYTASGNQRSWLLSIESGVIKLYCSVDGTAIEVTTSGVSNFFNNDVWHHVVAVYIPDVSVSLIVDGKVVTYDTTSIAASLYNSTAEIQIGAFGTTAYRMDGEIADVAVYAAAASNADAVFAFQSRSLPNLAPGSLLSASDLKGHWPLNEGFASATFLSAFDHSGNGNHGVNVSGGATPVLGEETIPQLSERGFTRVFNSDAVNDAFNTTSGLWSDNPGQDWTISATFLRPIHSGWDFIWRWQVTSADEVYLRTRDTDGQILVVIDDASVEEIVGNSPSEGSTYDLPLNTPVFLTVVHTASSNEFRVYADGVFKWAETYSSGLPASGANSFDIVESTTEGLWDEVSIFSQALSAAEVAELYSNAVLDVREHSQAADLEHYWRNGWTTNDPDVIEDLQGASDLDVFGAPDRIFLQARLDDAGRTAIGGHVKQKQGMNFGESEYVRLLGPHEADNPDLDDNVQGWISACSGPTGGDGYIEIGPITSGNCDLLTRTDLDDLVVGDYYLVRAVVDSWSAVSGSLQIELKATASATFNTVGVHEFVIQCPAGATNSLTLRLNVPDTVIARISHLSARKVTLPNIFNGPGGNGGTFAAWIKPLSMGGGNLARIFSKTSTVIYIESLSGGSCNLTFVEKRATTDGQWTTSTRLIELSAWNHIAIIYDDSNVANNPIFVINGVEKTVGSGITEAGAPVGVSSDDSSVVAVVGDHVTGSREFDGQIDGIAVWDGLRSVVEMQALFESQRRQYGV